MFRNSTGLEFSLDGVISKIKEFITEDAAAHYKLTIGTDSEEKTDKSSKKSSLEFITAIVVYRKGFGGKFFYTKKAEAVVKTLRDKIYQEVLESLQATHLLVPRLRLALNGKFQYDLEIHIDVGEGGQTREMIREVVGMVTGNGFVARTKPYSYAASNIADKYT